MWWMTFIFCLQSNISLKISSNWCYYFRCVARHFQIPQINKFAIFNILRNKWVMKCIFCNQSRMKVSFKSILWFWSGWSSIPKFSKIASLQSSLNGISKKKLQMKLGFFQSKLVSVFWASKCLQGDTIIIDGHNQTFSKYSK